MKRWIRWIVCIVIALAVMVVLPALVYRIIPPKAGFGIALLLHFPVNILTSTVLGIVAGRDMRGCFFVPLLPVVMFVGGLLIEGGIPTWPLPTIYFVCSAAAMCITVWVSQRRNEK